jgi:hypothetical protein
VPDVSDAPVRTSVRIDVRAPLQKTLDKSLANGVEQLKREAERRATN